MSTAKSIMTSLKVSLRALTLIFVLISTISYFTALILGPILFFSTSDGLAAAAQRIHGLYVLLFMIFDVPVQLETSLGILFVLIWAVFFVCMILAWFDRGGYLNSTKGALANPISLAKTNFLYIMPLVASALLSATIMISQFQESQGVQTGSINFPTTNPYVILTELSLAPLQEEFGFRITSIGLIVGILLMIIYWKDPRISAVSSKGKLVLLAMFSPELAKGKMGYRNIRQNGFPWGISSVEWVLILLTSLVFGLAHYLAGSGWEVGKVSTAFLAGFVFAIMYVAYGAYASILMHWFFNSYLTVLSAAGSAYGGIFNQLANLAYITNLLGGEVILVVFLLLTALGLGSYLAMKVSGHAGKSSLET